MDNLIASLVSAANALSCASWHYAKCASELLSAVAVADVVETLKTVEAKGGGSPSTVRNASRVYAVFAVLPEFERLSYSVAKVLSSTNVPDDLRKKAISEQWTVAQATEAVKALRTPKGDEPTWADAARLMREVFATPAKAMAVMAAFKQ